MNNLIKIYLGCAVIAVLVTAGAGCVQEKIAEPRAEEVAEVAEPIVKEYNENGYEIVKREGNQITIHTPIRSNLLGGASSSTFDTDTYIKSDDTGYGDDVRFRMGKTEGPNRWYRGLLSGTIVSGSGEITQIDLCVHADNYGGQQTTDIHEVTQTSWTEAGANWTTYDGSNTWASAGGDYDGTRINYSNLTTTGNWDCIAIQGGDAENPLSLDWESTYSLLFKQNGEVTAADAWWSTSDDEASQRPYLNITYSEAASAADTTKYNTVIYSSENDE